MQHVSAKQRPMVAAAIRTAFVQATKDDAHKEFRAVADRLRERFPRLSAMMDEAEHDVLAYMALPKDHWAQIHSTNPIERLNREVKRRTNVVGIFPNEAAIVRLVGAVLLVHAAFATLLAKHPRREGTLGKLQLGPLQKALQAAMT